jgi:hypothetical protein
MFGSVGLRSRRKPRNQKLKLTIGRAAKLLVPTDLTIFERFGEFGHEAAEAAVGKDGDDIPGF